MNNVIQFPVKTEQETQETQDLLDLVENLLNFYTAESLIRAMSKVAKLEQDVLLLQFIVNEILDKE